MLRAELLALVVSLLLIVPVLKQPVLAAVPEPDEYRTSRYDAEVPETLAGATRVSAVDVRQLMLDEGASVIDVLPEQRKPDDLPAGQLWFPVEHRGIAGSVWLPDVGFGVLSEVTEQYFLGHLQTISGADANHPLVFYCRADCWMSWNAARRAVANGYTRVYWFADGIEDWQFEDYDTEVLTPAKGLRQRVQ